MAKRTPDWEAVKKEVCTKIDLLKATYEGLDGELGEKIMDDLIVPCIEQLALFCASVKIEDNGKNNG